MIPIDKGSHNVVIICKKYYTEIIVKEIDFIDDPSNTYSTTNESSDKIIDNNVEYSKWLFAI